MSEYCGKCGNELVDVCPICGKPVEVYSRIVGYLTPIGKWNPGKQQEMKDRAEYLLWNGDHIA
jgi:anaerobic ribonucleoside-triphosphate reductase